jgi:hypothetical protein
MSKSVTLTFGEPEAPPAPAPTPIKAADPAAMTRDERTSANWQTLFVAWIVGLPSVMAVAFTGIVGLWYAFQFTSDVQTWLALSAGLIAITLFSAGMPIAAGLTRETQPVVAKAALVFWLACVAMNFGIMTHFAMNRPEPAPVSVMPVQSEEARQAIEEIADLRTDIAEAEARRDRWHGDTEVWYANAKARLARLERAHGVPSSSSAAPISGHGLDMAGVALLMIAGSALGMAISASSLAAILTGKAATVRLEAAPEAGPGAIIDAHSSPAGENADGFNSFAMRCISKLDGSSIRPAAAHAAYLQFCSANDYRTPLAIQEFGRQLSGYLANAYGASPAHSNGTIYHGFAVAQLGGVLNAPGVA